MLVLKLFGIQISLHYILMVYFNYIFLYFEQNHGKQCNCTYILTLFERKVNFCFVLYLVMFKAVANLMVKSKDDMK